MSLKYKLISCDMDDTLLKKDGTVSRRNLDAIHEFERRGGVFMANTGRMHTSAIRLVKGLCLLKNSPVSALQGAMISESETDKLLFFRPLGCDASLKLVLDCEEMGVHTQLYDTESLYCATKSAGYKPLYGEKYALRCGIQYTDVPSLSEYLMKTRMDNVKVIFMDEPEKLQRYLKMFEEKYGGIAKFNASAPYMGEAFSKEAGKDVACDVICARMGITINECIAFGDSMNDFAMLKHAGLGVAMANAWPEVLEIADYITDGSEDDGVGKAIEKLCL